MNIRITVLGPILVVSGLHAAEIATPAGTTKSIFDAIEKNNIQEVQRWIDTGINLNNPDLTREPLLITAIDCKTTEIVKLLLACNVNIECTTTHSNTAFMWAILRGNLERTILLLEHNANIEARNGHGRTPLMIAATYDPTRPDPNPNFKQNRIQIVKLLLSAGADSTKRDAYGNSASNLAQDPEAFSLLPLSAARCATLSDSLVGWASKSGMKSGSIKQKPGNIFTQLKHRETQSKKRLATRSVEPIADHVDPLPTQKSIEYAKKLAKLKSFVRQQDALMFCKVNRG